MKNGSATLFVVVAMVVTGIIFSYIFSRTANSEINALNNFSEIKKTYEQDLVDTDTDGLYDNVNLNVYTTIKSTISASISNQ